MRRLASLSFALIVVVGGRAEAADARRPTVVELFQSQGCSSCPPANANLIALSDRSDLLTLSFGVTYWDQLGWKDTFASPQFTERQWDYARALHHDNVGTPEVVVNGRADVVGQDRRELEALILREDRGSAGPDISIAGGVVTVGAVAGVVRSGEVLLIRYDPRTVQVPIRRGENGGRTLPHKDVVKALARLGTWSGRRATYALPSAGPGDLKTAILIQAGPGGPILAAAHD
jgi:hypothetical protein